MDGRKVNVQKIVAAYGLEKEHRVNRTSKSLNHKKKRLHLDNHYELS